MSAVLSLAACVAPFGQRAEFRKDAHQQLFATLHLQFSIDAPQVRVHGVGGQAEALCRSLLGIAVEDGADDAAFARRETETGRQ